MTNASQTQPSTTAPTATPNQPPTDIAAKLFPSSAPPAKAETKTATAPATAPAVQATAPSAPASDKPATQSEQPAAEAKQPPAAESDYTIKAPEGSDIDEEVLAAYQSSAKELGLPKDAAQNLIEKLTPVMRARADQQVQAARAAWVEASEKDAEFGGDKQKLSQSLSVARKALDSFGSPAFKELLESSGLGSHPEMIRLLWKAGKATADDGFVGGGRRAQQPVGAMTFTDLAEALYAPKAN